MTHLPNGPLVSEMAKSTEKMMTIQHPTASASKNTIQKNNISKGDKALAKSPSGMTKGGNQSSGKNLYQMDLGTMGIPREVAHMRNSNNPLFNSDNVAGPGDYNIKTDLISKRGPVVGFGKLPTKSMKNT